MDPRKWLFDKRVVRRNLDEGVLSMKAYRDHLKQAPDLEGEYETLKLDEKKKADEDG
jgi:hypothetical protein